MAASLVGQLALAVKGDLDRFRSDFRSQAPRIGDEVGTTLGARIKARLSAANIGTVVGATLGGLGVGALRLADDYKAAVDAIRVGTGATGEALEGLEASFQRVAGRVREDIGSMATVMAAFNTGLGLTGDDLEGLTERAIKFARITRFDLVNGTSDIIRLFGDWSVASEDQEVALDKVFRASQATWTVERVWAGEPLPVDLVFNTPTCAWTNLTPGERYLLTTAATDIAQAVRNDEPGLPAVTDPVAWSLGPDDALTLAPFDTYSAADYDAALRALTTLADALAVLAPDATQGDAPGPATHRGTEGTNYVYPGPLPSEVWGTTFIARYIGDERLPASPKHRLRDVRSYWHVLRVYAGGPLPEVLTLRNYFSVPPSLEPGRRYLVSSSDLASTGPENTLVWRLRAGGEVELVPYGGEDVWNWSKKALAIETLGEALAAVAPDAGAGEPPVRSGDRTPG